MKLANFDDLQAQIQRYYQGGEYAQALNLAIHAMPDYPEQAPLLYYWQICMAARLGDRDRAARLLSTALDEGLWYSEILLRKSPSLQDIQGFPAFERLVEQNRQQQLKDPDHQYPVIALHNQGECHSLNNPCPFLLALHGNQSTALASVDFWRSAASAGWLVAIPQSTQVMWKGAYVWNDMEAARDELVKHCEVIRGQYAIDPRRVVITGHSMGGELAMWLALTGALPAAGFIASGLGGPLTDEPSSWQPLIEQAQERSLRGYFIAGDQDDLISIPDIELVVKMLEKAGVPVELDILPGVTHAYSPEYAAALLRALDFILDVD